MVNDPAATPKPSRGTGFALVTLAFAEVFRIVALSVPFTGAGVGHDVVRRTGLDPAAARDERDEWSRHVEHRSGPAGPPHRAQAAEGQQRGCIAIV